MNTRKPKPGTLGFQQLEAERVKRAFDETRKSWWWLNEAQRVAHQDNPIAWQWELLRRSRTYRGFCAKAEVIRVHDTSDPSLSGLARGALQRLASSYRRLGDADPCRKWPDLFCERCRPDLGWMRLSNESRAVITSACPLYPRADYAEKFGSAFGLYAEAEPIVVKRLSSGGEELIPIGGSASTAVLGRCKAGGILPDGVPFGAYVVVVFDARFTERLLTELSAKKPNEVIERQLQKVRGWLERTDKAPFTKLRKSSARVLPSNVAHWCQAWIPANTMTSAGEVLSRLLTLVRSPYRRSWFPRCEEAWRVIDPLYSAESLTPVKAKRAHIDAPEVLQVGLCAYDWRPFEPHFTKNSVLARFLERFPSLGKFAGGAKLRDAMKQVRRIIEFIDQFYSAPSPPR